MRQVLIDGRGAFVARMPRPAIEANAVLVRVHYSLISTGTELAALRPQWHGLAGNEVASVPRVALTYLRKALRDPRKARQRIVAIARRTVAHAFPRRALTSKPVMDQSDIQWTRASAIEFSARGGMVELTTDDSEYGYQATTQALPVTAGMTPIIEIEGRVEDGVISVGLLDENRAEWLGSRNYDTGPVQDQLIFDPRASRAVTLVIANAGTKTQARASLTSIRVLMAAPDANALPLSELGDQGWNVGYSAAGEVVAVGAGVSDFAAGDLVACAGAGKANHADFVSVPRNLVCRVPRGCDLRVAATTTVGAIALHGVRRAAPQLGETVCVLGLGLIGQITTQLLRANGVKVFGLDLDSHRVAKALELGMDGGESDPEAFKVLVRDVSNGRGADRVLVTAATKSDAVINLAMEVARPKATVVIVGDVGLNVKRDIFYRKELDLLMSTSYGPGRYDRSYEEEGQDYPHAYVRWTLNRNMQAYMELAAAGRVDVAKLIERVVPVSDAPRIYKELASPDSAPLAVLLSYPDDTRALPEPASAARIVIRGARKTPPGVTPYALVGVGSFGTSMLVPQMAKRRDRFFLKAVVSRNTTAAGNFARANQIPIVTSELDEVLQDESIDLIVIATRHHEHADQVVRSLAAGKHVFVEKPLALSWEELDRIVACFERLGDKPVLMTGFNRRFSPALRALKSAIEARRSPLMVVYRLHAGYISLDHWVHGPQGGGRNIGEACHMYDCFRFLTGAEIRDIEARAIDPAALPYLRNDNFCASMRYADGSLCNLVYTALGPKAGLGKERVEVFCDGEAYVLDDYRSLIRATNGHALWQSDRIEKGHFEELCSLGDAIAVGGPSPIPFDELIETTAAALRVEDILRSADASS